MIGGAELEPGSGMFSPHKFPTEDVHAAISEREMLAAQHRRTATDPHALTQEATESEARRQTNLSATRCRRHEAEVEPFSNEPAPGDCKACKAAQTRAAKASPGLATPRTPELVRDQHLGMAEHMSKSAQALRDHLRSRTAALN